jgi:3-oxoacyl-[acyl-carrier protein] reductase
MDLGLKDRRAVIVAASKGLGRACAEAIAAEGGKVFISSRDAAAIEATGRAIKAAGWLAADVSKDGEPERLIEAAANTLGGIDILVANAGGPPAGTFQTTPLDGWDGAFHLTLMSAVRLVRSALPHLKASEQARVVFITSISVRQPIPNLVLSNSLRAAVTGLAKSLALELAPDHIAVNCLAPGAILTDRIRSLAVARGGDVEENLKRQATSAPMGRIGDPAEFGATCAFLCSRHAGYISGQTIGIDGAALVGVH